MDSTGLKICGQGEWHSKKHGEKYRRKWKKLHIGVDEAGWIHTTTLTDGRTQDPTVVPRLLESVSPELAVARITLPAQDFDNPERDAFCDDLFFNPWHGISAHQPMGHINRARRHLDEASRAERGGEGEPLVNADESDAPAVELDASVVEIDAPASEASSGPVPEPAPSD